MGGASERRASIASSRGSRAGSALRAAREGDGRPARPRGLRRRGAAGRWGGRGEGRGLHTQLETRPLPPRAAAQSRAARAGGLLCVRGARRGGRAAGSCQRGAGGPERPRAGWAAECQQPRGPRPAGSGRRGRCGGGVGSARARIRSGAPHRTPRAGSGRDAFGLDRAAPLAPAPLPGGPRATPGSPSCRATSPPRLLQRPPPRGAPPRPCASEPRGPPATRRRGRAARTHSSRPCWLRSTERCCQWQCQTAPGPQASTDALCCDDDNGSSLGVRKPVHFLASCLSCGVAPATSAGLLTAVSRIY